MILQSMSDYIYSKWVEYVVVIFLLSSRAHTNVDEGAKGNKNKETNMIPKTKRTRYHLSTSANFLQTWSGQAGGERDGWQIAVLANYCACVLGMAVPTKDIPYLGGYI